MENDINRVLSQALLRCNTLFIVTFQACLVSVSLILAWLLRFDFTLPYRTLLFSSLAILVLIRLASLAPFGLLHGWWRYTGVMDILDVAKAVVAGSAAFFVVMRLILRATVFPRSIYVLEALLTVGLLCGVRLLSRAIAESVRQDLKSSKKFAVVGAGFAAQIILREIRHRGVGYVAVACFDDDPSKRGIKVQGVPVMGSINELPSILKIHPVDEILIAIPSATSEEMRRFVSVCEQTEIRYRTVPSLSEFVAGQPALDQLRDVNLEDLLGREPVEMDLETVQNEICGRVVMVTGAAGTIGSELCRQILECQPRKLLCVDQNETGVFYLHIELSKRATNAQLAFVVADVSSRERLFPLLAAYQPDVIFHAAARKHVALMELNVEEVVRNNVFGLLHLLDAAEENGCRAFVLISSDKAVHPASAMGATKRACELIVACRPSKGMRCVSVRFGNVLGSSGSVIPVLQEQLRKNGELTITHPEMQRYFMTTREAVSLVLQAFAVGNQGEILLLDMNRPVRILDLALRLVKLSGKSAEDVRIRFTGVRLGEKLCEELTYSTEIMLPTRCPKVYRARGPLVNWGFLERQLEALRVSLATGDAAAVRARLKAIVPDYQYKSDSSSRAIEQVENTSPRPLARAVGRA
jgi:FlaA1/EpsC-like NDP-sugar epimerase